MSDSVKAKKKTNNLNGKFLTDEDHVIRYGSKNKFNRDVDGNITGLSPAFFHFRVDRLEQDLSCDWAEHFGVDEQEQFMGTHQGLVARGHTCAKSGKLVSINVGNIKTVAQEFDIEADVEVKGIKRYPSYSGIYGLPKDNSKGELLAALTSMPIRRISDIPD